MKSFLFYLFFTTQALAQGNGAIPLQYSATPATDLIYQGEQISASRAFELSKQGVDLSQLNPNEDQDIWKNKILKNIEIQNITEPLMVVDFKDFVLSQTGKLRFLAKTESLSLIHI